MIAVVDYGAGNLRSVCNALDVFAEEYRLARTPRELDGADGILLPGVGHFAQMMASLAEQKLDTRLQAEAAEGTPILGICLGMQAMFESSEEAPGVRGLGLFSGEVRRFRDVDRVPHMGWDEVRFKDRTQADLYFAHTYYAPIIEHTSGICEYGVPFSASIRRETLAGVQFHPEKSGEAGLRMLQGWCLSC